MATLVSPGVSVSVSDESFYGSAGAGTVPLIVLATGKNKVHPSGTGVAAGTTASAYELKLITSQRELLQSGKQVNSTPSDSDRNQIVNILTEIKEILVGIKNK